jgi:hypothetical protein
MTGFMKLPTILPSFNYNKTLLNEYEKKRQLYYLSVKVV